MRPLVLKAATTALTLGATLASALFVTSHIKNATAPLQPPVMASSSGVGSVVVVGPAVQPTTAPPITSTYAS
ncbi:MAG TPA: hypothetical protein VJR46_00265 [Candidatus Dormibacteraeota bacterium]|nr:hypothetical protein [Candidatus Dormibacteraeota bacterium]